MNEIDYRINLVSIGLHPEWVSKSDFWWAWYPVKLGVLGSGRTAYLQWVWRNQCVGVTIYQPINITSSIEQEFTNFKYTRKWWKGKFVA